METRAKFLTALLAGLLALALAPGVAAAKKRIIVLDFSGPKAAKFQRDVTKIIKSKHSVVSSDKYVSTARKLDASKPTAGNVARVASRLNADGVLIGFVKRVGAKYKLTLRMRTGEDGSFTDTITVTTKRGSLSKANKNKIKRELLASIRALPAIDGGDVEEMDDDDDDIEELDDDDDDGDDDDDVAVRDDDDDDDDDVRGTADTGPPLTDEEKADLMVRGRGLEAAAGVSLTGRRLTFTVSDGLGDASPRGYDGAYVAGAVVTGELYPLAFNMKNRGKSRNLGISGVFDQVIKIESKLLYTDPMTNQTAEAVLGTEQIRWGVGAVYRHNFGDKPTSPTVKLSVRYNRLKFVIAKEDAPAGVTVDIPNVDYTYVDPGLGIRFPLSPKMALVGEGRFLFITDTGEMQAPEQYGSATVTGLEADAHVEYMLDPRLSVRIGGAYRAIGFDFDGSGELTNNRDGDPTTTDVGGALDRYMGGYAVAGYLF